MLVTAMTQTGTTTQIDSSNHPTSCNHFHAVMRTAVALPPADGSAVG